MTRHPVLLRLFHLLFCAAFLAPAAHAAASLLISPINPVIEAGRNAGAIWVENRGNSPVLLQARVFAWQQAEGEDRYSRQDAIVSSPPMVEIAPRSRQIIRLVRASIAQQDGEAAYRLLLDEVPTRKEAERADETAPPPGVQFRLRYSLPLFTYGGKSSNRGEPQLQCAVIRKDGEHMLEIRNSGNMHARLVDAAFVEDGRHMPVGRGLLGYALAGSALRVPLADALEAHGSFSAKVNESAEPFPLSACAMQ